MPVDENRSLWLAGKERYRAASPLSRDISADVAIVGGGFTGVSTAYHLAERFPEKRIVLLEAGLLAGGASGRNGGQMVNGLHGIEVREPQLAKRLYDTTCQAIDEVEAIIRRHDLSVPFRREGRLEIMTDARSADGAAARAESSRKAGIPLRFLDRSELRRYLEVEGGEGALLDPLAGELDGVAFLRGLRPILQARGVAIHEHSPVLRVREGRAVTLETPSGEVRAGAVVLATNAYTPDLGYFRNRLFALHSHVIGTEPLSVREWREIGWHFPGGFIDDRRRLSYGTLTPSGRLLFGGGSNAAYSYLYGNRTCFPGSAERRFARIRRQLVTYFPRSEPVGITHRWTGTLAVTLSRLCTMGRRGEYGNVYFALGYSGHGVTLANLAGRILCDLMSGEEERWHEMPFYRQRLRYIPSEPFRWLGYHSYTRLTGRSPRVQP